MGVFDRMRRRISAAAIAIVLGFAPGVLAQDGLPACIRVEGVARWAAAGYNHIVRVTNGCTSRAHCQVSTDVNPRVQEVTVERGATAEVVTFLDSPASAFTPHVTCTLDR